MSAAISGAMSEFVANVAALTWATRATRARSKRVVKSWLALICAIPIRSLRTKWSRMENKAVVLLFSCLGGVSITASVARMSSAISGAMSELSRMSLGAFALRLPRARPVAHPGYLLPLDMPALRRRNGG